MKKNRATRKTNYAEVEEELNRMSNINDQQQDQFSNQLLDVNDMCRLFKVKPQTIHKWKRKKLIKTTQFSRRLTFHRDDVQAFINSKRKA